MMEVLFAIAVVSFAAGGIGLGIVLGRGPARTSCGGADDCGTGRCADCPLRPRAGKERS
jgi:hypothetical protein